MELANVEVINQVNLNGSDMSIFEKGGYFEVSLSDSITNSPLINQNIIFSINGVNYSKLTDENGIARLQINLGSGDYSITSSFLGNDEYNGATTANIIHVRDTETTFIEEGLSNDEIQDILDNAKDGDVIEFLGHSYENITLTINKELSLVSNVGTILKGNSLSNVVKISSCNVKISGFTVSKGTYGIFIEGVNSIEISDNTFTDNNIGGGFNNVDSISISDNTFIGGSSSIHAESSSNIDILGNELFNSSNTGIYSSDNDNVIINGNVISSIGINRNHFAIVLDGYAENMEITYNNLSNNKNGILVDCTFENLTINYNTIQYNQWDGIKLGENYRKDSEGNDFKLETNALLNNGDFNIVARDTIYYDNSGPAVSFDGYNWLGSTNSSFNGICPKVSINQYGSFIVSDGENTYFMIGDGSNAQNNLPSFSMTIKDGNGAYSVINVENGVAKLPMGKGDQGITIRTPDGEIYIENSNYDPNYVPDSNTPSENPGNGTQSGGSGQSQGSSDSSGSESGELEGVVGTLSGAIGSSNMNPESSASSAASESSSSSASSRSVAKTLDVDEEIVRIAGVGVIFIIIILIIGAYYRNDIKDMLEKRKEDE